MKLQMRLNQGHSAIFSLRSCTACARVLSLCMLSPLARGAARDGLAALGVLGGSAAKWTNVVWPIKSRPTNRQTNTHYSFIGIDHKALVLSLFGTLVNKLGRSVHVHETVEDTNHQRTGSSASQRKYKMLIK